MFLKGTKRVPSLREGHQLGERTGTRRRTPSQTKPPRPQVINSATDPVWDTTQTSSWGTRTRHSNPGADGADPQVRPRLRPAPYRTHWGVSTGICPGGRRPTRSQRGLQPAQGSGSSEQREALGAGTATFRSPTPSPCISAPSKTRIHPPSPNRTAPAVRLAGLHAQRCFPGPTAA